MKTLKSNLGHVKHLVTYPTYSRGCHIAEIQNKYPCIIRRISGGIPGNHYDVPYLMEYVYVENEGNP